MTTKQNQIKKILSLPSNIEFVRNLLEKSNFPHRTALALHLCKHFEFYDFRGKTQQGGCLKALRKLASDGHFVLPAPRNTTNRATPRRLKEPVPVPKDLPCTVNDVQDLHIKLVSSQEEMRIWNEMMINEHPQQAGPLVGRQLRYLIDSAHGWLGGFGFASAALCLSDRDKWIGWDANQRQKYLQYIISLSRFLIRPHVNCQNLASKVLSMCLSRLSSDFEKRYGYSPILVESFIDDSHHLGTSYRAANWISIGKTKGRGRQDRFRNASLSIKSIYMYPLRKDFRAFLGLPLHAGKGKLSISDGLESGQWAQNEFGNAPLNDKRLSNRLVDMAEAQAKAPEQAFTALQGSDWPFVKASYRFIDHPDESAVNMTNIMAPHRERTIQRMMGQNVVLCVQDGSDLNFNNLQQCKGLGYVTGGRSRGLHLHSTLAISSTGIPLGVLKAECTAREKKEVEDKRDRNKIPIEEKNTFAWIEHYRNLVEISRNIPQTRLISVCDREADFFELFDEQRRSASVDLLIRAKQDRKVKNGMNGETEGDVLNLFELARQAPILSKVIVNIPRQAAREKKNKLEARSFRSARKATLTVRAARVQLQPPIRHANKDPIGIWIIHAKEDNPPQGEDSIEWFLLTTMTIANSADAEQCLRWYCLRWRIEDWHRVLKSGCRIEELAHKTAERLRRAIAINLVIAWRIMVMTLLGREQPELPAEILFSDVELRVLNTLKKKSQNPINLGEAVRLVAKLGGYLGRNSDPPPGHQVIWRGYIALQHMCTVLNLVDPFVPP